MKNTNLEKVQDAIEILKNGHKRIIVSARYPLNFSETSSLLTAIEKLAERICEVKNESKSAEKYLKEKNKKLVNINKKLTKEMKLYDKIILHLINENKKLKK